MDRRLELENLRRSIAMLTPDAPSGLSREDGLDLIEELQAALDQLQTLSRDRPV